jgi:hypothetical protein
MVAITAGVAEGEPVDGVRYRGEAHLTGWFLFAASYAGDSEPEDFLLVHAIHLFEERPEVAEFLALPVGWCFDTNRPGQPWFDPEVARDDEPDD